MMKQQNKETALPPARDRMDAQPTILLVDDEANMRHMLAALLAKHGYIVAQAADGTAALEMITEQDFDYVLSDVRMPGMDGLELLKRIIEGESSATVSLCLPMARLNWPSRP